MIFVPFAADAFYCCFCCQAQKYTRMISPHGFIIFKKSVCLIVHSACTCTHVTLFETISKMPEEPVFILMLTLHKFKISVIIRDPI